MQSQDYLANPPELQIINNLVYGLRNKFQLGQDQVYPIIAPAYVIGQNPRVIQVSPSTESTDGEGSGAQAGGALIEILQIRLTFWYRLNTDEYKRSDQMLTEEYWGFMAWCNNVRNSLLLTTLGGVLYRPMVFISATEPSWYDEEESVARRDMLWQAPFARNLPTELTMTEQDVQPLLTT